MTEPIDSDAHGGNCPCGGELGRNAAGEWFIGHTYQCEACGLQFVAETIQDGEVVFLLSPDEEETDD